MGAPRSWSASRNFIQVPVDAIKQLGGTDALVLARIIWRCETHENAWQATLDQIATETGFSKRTVGDSTRRLREKDYIGARRSKAYDATMVWSVRYEDCHPEEAENVVGGTEPATSESTEPATSSYETETTTRDTHAADAASALGEHFAARLEANGRKRPSVTASWLTTLTSLIDEHGTDVVRSMIDWAQASDFWRSRTTTPNALAKHWDTLRQQRAEQRGKGVHKPEVSDDAAARYREAF